jgi:molybdenum cofactor cytidylyltransferase
MSSVETEKIGIILLAAGFSSRMGEPKQLLKVHNEPLIRIMIRQALASDVSEVVVVLGHHASEIEKAIGGLPVHITLNKEAAKGMGGSIKCGVRSLNKMACSAALIITCDQPLLTSSHLKKIVEAYREKRALIVASGYAGSVGIPVLFDQKLFDSILSIDDNAGAKKIINENISDTFVIDFPEGKIDLDTPEDYRSFQQLVDRKPMP